MMVGMRRWSRLLLVALPIAALIGGLAFVRCRGSADSTTTAATGSASTQRGSVAVSRGTDPRLGARGTIAGTVKTAAGAPIANALVCADPDDELITAVIHEPVCSTSDVRGQYTIGELLPALYTISATARSYASGVHHPGGDKNLTFIELTTGARKTGIDVVLVAGTAALTGTITDITGGPIAHARIAADDARTETDDAGTYSLPVEPGDVWLTVSASGYASRQLNTTAPGKLSLALTPESTVSGTVVNADGAPVAGALVTFDSEGEAVQQDVSAADGHFTLVGVEPGTYQLIARAAHGFGRSERTAVVGFAAHVTGVTVTLHPAFEIAGTVTADGRPCNDAHVYIEDEHDHRLPVRSRPNGVRSTLAALPGTYTVSAWCEGFAPMPEQKITIVDRDVTGQIWPLVAGVTVTGRVLDRRRDPVAGAVVSISGNGFGFSSDHTAADGTYAITGVPPASYDVEVKRGQGRIKLADPIAVADHPVDHDLLVDDVGTIRCTVADSDGRPAPRIEVNVNGEGSFLEQVWSGDDGVFSLDGVPAGHYSLSPRENNLAATRDVEVEVHAGQTTNARLELIPRDGSIHGTVVDGTGAPIADAYVTAAGTAVTTDTAGAFEIRSLRGRQSYEVTAYRAGGGFASVGDVEVGATVRLQLRTPGSIEGIVIGAPDQATILVRGATQSCSITVLGAGGHYACDGLAPGHYVVSADIRDRYAQLEVDLAEGEHKRGVDVRVQSLTTIVGRMVDARTHAPIAGLAVHMMEPGGDVLVPADGPSGTDGRFTIRNQTPGRWMIYGASSGDAPPLCAELREVTGEQFDAGDLPVVSERPEREYSLGFELSYLEGQRDPRAWRATVLSVEPGSSAAKAGLRAGDVITAVNGNDVTGPHVALLFTYAFASPGGAARLTLANGGTVTVQMR